MANIGSTHSIKPLEIHISPGDDKTFQPAPLPVDSDGFIVAFNVEQEEEILTFFEKHGVVVVANVLTEQQCERSVDDVWAFLQELQNPDIQRDKPETWNSKWPRFSHMGILGNERWLYPQACDNRQNPNIYKVFQTLFGDHELMVNITRAGLMRPTKDIYFPSLNKTEDREQWKTMSNWLHMDMNPLTGRATTFGYEHVAERHCQPSQDPLTAQNQPTNNGMRARKLQAVLALVDCRKEDGGFHAVPGFQHYIATWAKENEKVCLRSNYGGDPTTVQIPPDDPIREHIQCMPIRKGSLLVWDSRLPHGNYPNNSNQMRIIQYLHMAPVADEALRPFPLLQEDLPETFQLTELGEKLYGFQPWESAVAQKRFQEKRNPIFSEEANYDRLVRHTMKELWQKSKKN
jgi:ectoine hydroxylase-related dioxygenase (phytanoyl-CoA dioxygenase family)